MSRDATRTGCVPDEVVSWLADPCRRRGPNARRCFATDRTPAGLTARARAPHRVTRWSALLGVGLLLLPGASVEAGAPTDQLKASIEQVIRVLEDPALKPAPKTRERREAIRKIADTIFDFEETAKRALGPHWQALGEKDRQEFVGLFANLLERSYISRIERYRGEQIVYTGDSIDGNLATVRTRFTTRKGVEVQVDYRALRRGERWMVYDVNVEGVSLVNNYRTQFNKIIRTGSYQELVAKMKSNDEELMGPGASKDKGKTPGS
jgi:phospholipid transport system substrate-binding protein